MLCLSSGNIISSSLKATLTFVFANSFGISNTSILGKIYLHNFINVGKIISFQT